MQTVLDDARMWQLHAAVYQDNLRIVLTEMFVGEHDAEPPPGSSEAVQEVLRGSKPIEVRDDSRMMVVSFSRVVAWQIVDESYTAWDDYEIRDDTGVLQILSRSKYLDYVNESHGWYKDIIGPAEHYRVWSGDEVVDVVSCDQPTVGPWEPDT